MTWNVQDWSSFSSNMRLGGYLPWGTTPTILHVFQGKRLIKTNKFSSDMQWQHVAPGNRPYRVVLAAKRQQDWRTIPIPMTVVSGEQLSFGGMPGGSRTALLLDAATSSTNLGPGRERQFIRGVADSAFLGPSQATVSVQFDDARATYDAPDPDLLLLDVTQVEILKGPQGPLYGTGALGGVFHIVPRRPDLQQFDWQSTLQWQQVRADDAGAGGSLMINAPLLRDRLAVRAVAYARTEPGWIDNAGARADANDTRIQGARLAVRSTLPARSLAWKR
jgi:outer membrane receptor protein involved in Fe transport